MRHLEAIRRKQLPRRLLWWAGLLPLAFWLSVLGSGVAQGGGFRSPEACQAYTGEQHLNCLYSYIGARENTASVEGYDTAEDEILDQLREQREQIGGQTSADDPQRSLGDRTQVPAPAVVPAPRSETTIPSFRSPEECRAYTGDAHLNCLYAYIEMQQDKTGKVEEELKTQKNMLGRLRDRVEQQAAANFDLERRLTERGSAPPATIYVPPPLYPGYGDAGFGYPGLGYSSPGLSLYFGVPGYYYGRPFYGPRFFGQRFYGPRFYGSRSFGHRRR